MRENKNHKTAYNVFGYDGHLHQLEHAKKTVNNSKSSLGIETKEGIILLSHNTSNNSKLLRKSSITQIYSLDSNCAMTMSGHTTDGRMLAEKLREYIEEEKSNYGELTDVKVLAHKISNNLQETIQSTELRPYGVSLLIGGLNKKDEPQLYKVDIDGTTSAWKSICIGKQSSKIMDMIERNYIEDITLTEGKQLLVNSFVNQINENITPEMISIIQITKDNGLEKIDNEEINNLIQNVGDLE